MITYVVYDNTGNLVEAWDNRAESLAAFVRFISQDASDMAWFACDENGSIIESLIFDPNPALEQIAAPPARPRGRKLSEARRDWDKREAARKAAQDREWEEDHFCEDCSEPINHCSCGRYWLDDVHAW